MLLWQDRSDTGRLSLRLRDLRGRYECRYYTLPVKGLHKQHRAYDLHYEDHLLFQLAIVVILRADLPVEVQQLLEVLVLGRHDILDDWHEQLRLPYIHIRMLFST